MRVRKRKGEKCQARRKRARTFMAELLDPTTPEAIPIFPLALFSFVR